MPEHYKRTVGSTFNELTQFATNAGLGFVTEGVGRTIQGGEYALNRFVVEPLVEGITGKDIERDTYSPVGSRIVEGGRELQRRKEEALSSLFGDESFAERASQNFLRFSGEDPTLEGFEGINTAVFASRVAPEIGAIAHDILTIRALYPRFQQFMAKAAKGTGTASRIAKGTVPITATTLQQVGVEAGVEAATNFEELRKKGFSDNDAGVISANIFANNMKLLFGSKALEVILFRGQALRGTGIYKYIRQGFRNLTAGGVVEVFQEEVQDEIAKKAPTFDKVSFAEALDPAKLKNKDDLSRIAETLFTGLHGAYVADTYTAVQDNDITPPNAERFSDSITPKMFSPAHLTALTATEKSKQLRTALRGLTVTKNGDLPSDEVYQAITRQAKDGVLDSLVETIIKAQEEGTDPKFKDKIHGDIALPTTEEIASALDKEIALQQQQNRAEEGQRQTVLETPQGVRAVGDEVEFETDRRGAFNLRDFNLKEVENTRKADAEAVKREGFEGVYDLQGRSRVFEGATVRKVLGDKAVSALQTRQRDEFVKKTQQLVPSLRNAPIEFVESLAGGNAFGAYVRGEGIQLSEDRIPTTLPHEAFHHFREHMIDDAVWSGLKQEVQNNYAEELNAKIKAEGDIDIATEEVLADLYADWVVSRQAKGKIQRFFEDLSNILREIFGAQSHIVSTYRQFAGDRARQTVRRGKAVASLFGDTAPQEQYNRTFTSPIVRALHQSDPELSGKAAVESDKAVEIGRALYTINKEAKKLRDKAGDLKDNHFTRTSYPFGDDPTDERAEWTRYDYKERYIQYREEMNSLYELKDKVLEKARTGGIARVEGYHRFVGDRGDDLGTFDTVGHRDMLSIGGFDFHTDAKSESDTYLGDIEVYESGGISANKTRRTGLTTEQATEILNNYIAEPETRFQRKGDPSLSALERYEQRVREDTTLDTMRKQGRYLGEQTFLGYTMPTFVFKKGQVFEHNSDAMFRRFRKPRVEGGEAIFIGNLEGYDIFYGRTNYRVALKKDLTLVHYSHGLHPGKPQHRMFTNAMKKQGYDGFFGYAVMGEYSHPELGIFDPNALEITEVDGRTTAAGNRYIKDVLAKVKELGITTQEQLIKAYGDRQLVWDEATTARDNDERFWKEDDYDYGGFWDKLHDRRAKTRFQRIRKEIDNAGTPTNIERAREEFIKNGYTTPLVEFLNEKGNIIYKRHAFDQMLKSRVFKTRRGDLKKLQDVEVAAAQKVLMKAEYDTQVDAGKFVEDYKGEFGVVDLHTEWVNAQSDYGVENLNIPSSENTYKESVPIFFKSEQEEMFGRGHFAFSDVYNKVGETGFAVENPYISDIYRGFVSGDGSSDAGLDVFAHFRYITTSQGTPMITELQSDFFSNHMAERIENTKKLLNKELAGIQAEIKKQAKKTPGLHEQQGYTIDSFEGKEFVLQTDTERNRASLGVRNDGSKGNFSEIMVFSDIKGDLNRALIMETPDRMTTSLFLVGQNSIENNMHLKLEQFYNQYRNSYPAQIIGEIIRYFTGDRGQSRIRLPTAETVAKIQYDMGTSREPHQEVLTEEFLTETHNIGDVVRDARSGDEVVIVDKWRDNDGIEFYGAIALSDVTVDEAGEIADEVRSYRDYTQDYGALNHADKNSIQGNLWSETLVNAFMSYDVLTQNRYMGDVKPVRSDEEIRERIQTQPKAHREILRQFLPKGRFYKEYQSWFGTDMEQFRVEDYYGNSWYDVDIRPYKNTPKILYQRKPQADDPKIPEADKEQAHEIVDAYEANGQDITPEILKKEIIKQNLRSKLVSQTRRGGHKSIVYISTGAKLDGTEDKGLFAGFWENDPDSESIITDFSVDRYDDYRQFVNRGARFTLKGDLLLDKGNPAIYEKLLDAMTLELQKKGITNINISRLSQQKKVLVREYYGQSGDNLNITRKVVLNESEMSNDLFDTEQDESDTISAELGRKPEDYLDGQSQKRYLYFGFKSKGELYKGMKNVYNTIFKKGIPYLTKVISERIRTISPQALVRANMFHFTFTEQHNTLRAEVIVPFAKKYRKMTKQDKDSFRIAIRDRNMAVVNRLAEKNGMADEYRRVRELLDKMHKDLTDAGYHVGYIENYFPSFVKNPEAFVEYLGGITTPEVNTAIDKENMRRRKHGEAKMNSDELAEFLNDELVEQARQKRKLPQKYFNHDKKRKIDEITGDMMEFYGDPITSLDRYIQGYTRSMAAVNFFAETGAVFTPQRIIDFPTSNLTKDSVVRGKLDVRASVEKYTLSLGEMTLDQRNQLNDMLEAEIRPPKGTHKFISQTKGLIYLITLGTPLAAIQQLGDLAYNFHRYGTITALRGLGRSLSNIRRIAGRDTDFPTFQDVIGKDGDILEEFRDDPRDGWFNTLEWFTKTTKVSGFRSLDLFAKGVTLNAALIDFQKRLNKQDPQLREDIATAFGNREDIIASVENDIRNGTLSWDVKFLLFNALSEVQPITMLEVPAGYVNHPFGRFVYVLQTWVIKMLNNIARDAVAEMNKPGTVNKGKGLVKMTRLLMILAIANAAVEELEDLAKGDLKDFGEVDTLDAVLRVVGSGRYDLYQAQKVGVFQAAVLRAAPPINVFEYALDSERAVLTVPYFGKPYYHWFGAGSKRDEEERDSFLNDFGFDNSFDLGGDSFGEAFSF